MLPDSVMVRIKEEFLNYGGLGASVIEISHRSKDFTAIVDAAKKLGPFRAVIEASGTYRWLYDLLRPRPEKGPEKGIVPRSLEKEANAHEVS